MTETETATVELLHVRLEGSDPTAVRGLFALPGCLEVILDLSPTLPRALSAVSRPLPSHVISPWQVHKGSRWWLEGRCIACGLCLCKSDAAVLPCADSSNSSSLSPAPPFCGLGNSIQGLKRPGEVSRDFCVEMELCLRALCIDARDCLSYIEVEQMA